MESKVERAVLISTSGLIKPHDLGIESSDMVVSGSDTDSYYSSTTMKDARAQLERSLITQSLERHGGNVKRAAEELGVARPTLYDMIAKYNIPGKHSDLSDL